MILTLAALVVATAMSVDDQPLTAVSWAEMPRPEFPAAAMSRDIQSGQARLDCTVKDDGRLSGCQILSETPEGAGFGQAALAAVASARVSEDTMAQAPDDRRVNFTIRFVLG